MPDPIPMPAPGEAIATLSVQIFQLSSQLLAWGDHFVAPEGLTSARWQMLGAIALAGAPQTAPQIAARMGTTRQGAQKQINLLLADGLLEAHENAAHMRSLLYSLTPQGAAVYESVSRRWLAQAAAWGAGLEAGDLAAAVRVLKHLSNAISTHHTQQEK